MSVGSISPVTPVKSVSKTPLPATPRDLTAGLMGHALANSNKGLSKSQKDGLASLANYIKNNVKGDDATKLNRDMTALRSLMQTTSAFSTKRSSAYDMVTNDLFGNSNDFFLPTGMILNRLI